jgi:ABC-type nitrate/sulfonate/bicarbonate transport system permease component
MRTGRHLGGGPRAIEPSPGAPDPPGRLGDRTTEISHARRAIRKTGVWPAVASPALYRPQGGRAAADNCDTMTAVSRLARWSRDYALALSVFGVLLVVWEAAVRLGGIPTFVLPAPSVIAAKFWTDLALLRQHALVTLYEILVGYLVAAGAGLLIAVLVVRFKTVEQIVYPYIVASQTIPKIAVAPLLIIWLGAGMLPKILIVAVTAFFPVTVNTVTGLRAAEENYLNLLRSVAATETQVFVHLRVPYALPFVFAGLKLATTLSVLGAIVAEFMGASEGLGYLILSSTFNFEVPRVFVSLIALVSIGVLFFGLVSWLERRLSWRQEVGTKVVHPALA